jgi:hypothetical protein
LLKRQLGAVLLGLTATVAVPITVAQATQPAHSTFRSTESEAHVATSLRPQETRASRSELRQAIPAQLLRQVGKSLRAAERLHERQIAAARAQAAAIAQAQAQAAQAAATQKAGPAPSYSGSGVKGYAAQQVAAHGWSSSEFSCLDSLWTHESGWNYQATNSSSGAYGIPQALPGSKMASAGADWQTNPDTQIRWGLDYISQSYGSPCAALSHSQATGYY